MKRSAALVLVVVLLAALGVRLAAACWWQARLSGRFLFGDSESYWVLGRAIAHGGPYEYGSPDARVFRAPGYPLLLAPLFVFGGDQPPVLAARVLGALLGTMAVAGVGWLAGRLFGPRAGLLAAGIAAIEPGTAATSVMVLSEALFCPLMVLHLALWIAAWFSPEPTATGMARDTRRRRWLRAKQWLAAGAGLAAGAAALTRPSWLLFTPLAVLLALVADRERKRHLHIGAVMLAGLVVAMLPWWIRNYRVIGRFVPTTLQVGTSLYDGWNPQATGASDLGFVARFFEEEHARPAQGNDADAPLEYRVDRRMRRAAIAWAAEHSGAALRLAAVKLVRTWNVWPNEKGLSAWPIRLALVATYVPIILLAALGAVRTIRRGWPYVLCWLPAAYFTLLHTVFVGSIRYRMPAMLTLIVLAAGALSSGQWSVAGGRWSVVGSRWNEDGA
jgi:4-amino-4-deoxy-L-arabinose transferase-like glycosyltransferase